MIFGPGEKAGTAFLPNRARAGPLLVSPAEEDLVDPHDRVCRRHDLAEGLARLSGICHAKRSRALSQLGWPAYTLPGPSVWFWGGRWIRPTFSVCGTRRIRASNHLARVAHLRESPMSVRAEPHAAAGRLISAAGEHVCHQAATLWL